MTNTEIIAKAMEANNIVEPIHTFEGWKSLGFKVKKGEKTMIRISIWKPCTNAKKKTEKVENEDSDKVEIVGNFFLKNSCFFGLHQVEKA